MARGARERRGWPVARCVVTFSALTTVFGCGPRPVPLEPPTDDSPIPVVIERVNANSKKMDFLLRGGGVSATVRYREDGAPATQELSGILLYRKPRDLYLSLEHTLGGKLEVGSNGREFWVWERIKEPRYWWGRHERAEGILDADLPVRPDVLLEVLGLQDLPTHTTGPHGPLSWVGLDRYELLFLDSDETGQLQLVKAIDIDRREPFLVRSIVYFQHGRPVTVAKLSRYEVVEGSDVLAPRTIHIDLLEREGSAHLEFLTMKRFDKPGVDRFFVSPRQRGEKDLGEVIQVGREPSASRPTGSRPATQPSPVTQR